MRDFFAKIMEKDWYTWVGHGVQGIIFTLAIGWFSLLAAGFFVLGAFLHREVSDLLKHWALKDKSPREYLEDGWMDFISPIMGYVIGVLLLFLMGVT
jgi:hypothetical protein